MTPDQFSADPYYGAIDPAIELDELECRLRDCSVLTLEQTRERSGDKILAADAIATLRADERDAFAAARDALAESQRLRGQIAALWNAADRLLELYDSQYLVGKADGGRVKHSISRLREARGKGA